jgi:exopolysaccharide production protein ExoZ
MRFNLVQIFRGIAALLVVSHHLIANSTTYLGIPAFHNFFNFGFIGVDFFFVLSGFIITYIHFPDIINKGDWKTFLKKRIIRIYPIYWVIATMTLVIYILITPQQLKDVGLSMDFRIPAIRSFVIEGYLLIPQQTIRLVGVAWSLPYEMLFYILFGVCIVMGYKWTKLILSFWIFAILANALFLKSANYYVDFLLNILILEFMLGCVVGYLILKKTVISAKILVPLALVLTVILMNTMKIYGLAFTRELSFVLMIGAAFSILTYLTVQFDFANPHTKYPKILLLLGDASYSIYLFHNFLLSGLCRIYIKLNPQYASSINRNLVCVCIFIITIFLGVMIHLIVEKRLIKFFSEKFLPKKKPVIVTSA